MLFAALIPCLLTAPAASQPDKVPKLDARTIHAAAERAAAAGQDRIWPGFDFRRYTSLADGALRFSDAGEGKPGQVFMTVSDNYFASHTAEEGLLITFHEAFHGFQRDPARPGAKWGAENAMLVFEYADTTARNNALFRIEGQLLYAALRATGEEEARQRVRQFLAVRQMRQHELDPRFVAFEKGAELNEGLAEYAGVQGVLLGLEAVKQQRLRLPVAGTDPTAYLAAKYEKLKTITQIGKNWRLKFYYTGSAQALLLDRLAPGWKAQVQQKAAAVQDLLLAAAGDGAVKTDAVLEGHGYTALLKEEEATTAKRQEEARGLLESVRNQKGRRYTLDLSASKDMGRLGSFDPMNVTVVDRQHRVHTRMLQMAAPGRWKAEFNQPVIQDFAAQQYVTVAAADEKQTIDVDGAPLDLAQPGERRFTKLVITTPRLRLEAERGTVTVGPAGVVVKPEG
jgi:hypothetical protein